MINLYEKFKGKKLFITIQSGTLVPTYQGTILSQEGEFIEFQTDINVIWFNLNYLIKFTVAQERAL